MPACRCSLPAYAATDCLVRCFKQISFSGSLGKTGYRVISSFTALPRKVHSFSWTVSASYSRS